MTDPSSSPDISAARKRPRLLIVAALAVACAAVLVVVIFGGPAGDAQARSCAPARDLAARLKPLTTGEIAAVQTPARPGLMPDLAFAGPDGQAMTLADLRGRTVLLNLWATWCAPCRKEMPALDALQAALGGPDFEVVAINIDTRDANRPRAWLTENGVTRLRYFADPTARVFQDLKAVGKALGMPTTLLIDPQGCELGYLAGPAEWASPEAKAYIRAALGRE